MVLESLINPFKAERHPWEMFFIGFLYSSIAVGLSLWLFGGRKGSGFSLPALAIVGLVVLGIAFVGLIFWLLSDLKKNKLNKLSYFLIAAIIFCLVAMGMIVTFFGNSDGGQFTVSDHSSIVAVLLTVLAATPFMVNLIKFEEKKEIDFTDNYSILKQHSKALLALMFLFIGITFSFLNWYIFLPSHIAVGLFSAQIETYFEINSAAVSSFSLMGIFFNNLKVLLLCLLFAFLYGAGAIFILAWNASVIAVAIGNFIKSKSAELAAQSSSYLSHIPVYFVGNLRYALHGFFEIAAYFIAGLAGGIISVAVIRHRFNTKSFEKTLLDSTILILIAIAILVLAAILEVYVSPRII